MYRAAKNQPEAHEWYLINTSPSGKTWYAVRTNNSVFGPITIKWDTSLAAASLFTASETAELMVRYTDAERLLFSDVERAKFPMKKAG